MGFYHECAICQRQTHPDEAVIVEGYVGRLCLYCVEELNELAKTRKAA